MTLGPFLFDHKVFFCLIAYAHTEMEDLVGGNIRLLFPVDASWHHVFFLNTQYR